MNKKNIVSGHKLKVGDRVRVVDATAGAYGANGKIGTVVAVTNEGFSGRIFVEKLPVREEEVSGLDIFNPRKTIIIKLDNPAGMIVKNHYWRVGAEGEYELLSPRKKHFDIDVVMKGDITKVIVEDDKVGISRCNTEDKFNEAYGVILAIARAYKFDKEKMEAIVDALYGDVKKLEDYDSVELINELRKRV